MEAKSNIVCCLQMVAMFLVYTVLCDDPEEESIKSECSGSTHVCTTLMKYPDGYVADEGPYCSCKNGDCGSAFSSDERSFTWQHYEKAHLFVQYRFCNPVIDDYKPVCDDDELAAVIKTDVTVWRPWIDDLRCRCPKGVYQMMGWKKEGAVWKYFYHCQKEECQKDNSECAEILLDPNKKTDIVTEVKFSCACRRGHLCPAKIKDESEYAGASSKTVHCVSIKQSNKKD